MNELQSLEQQLQTIFQPNTGMEDMAWKDSMKGLLFDLSSYIRKGLDVFRKPLVVADLGPARGIEDRKNYMDLMPKFIITPDGFQGNMTDFVVTLTECLWLVNKTTSSELDAFNRWLGKVISDGNLNISMAPSFKTMLAKQDALKTWITDKPTTVTFGQAFTSLGAFPATVEKFNQGVRSVKITAPAEFHRRVARTDELSDILYKLMESGEVDLGDTTGNKFIAEKLMEMARFVTFAGSVFALTIQTGNALTETAKRLAK